ncbi:hypothetical protein [Mycobacterium sp. JS623]|uniref:hypothetical protein n=1 Tax=Mycobacterium sp. JS623 TaxID=212767 RepID=UPI00059D018D|nr:hypothetical protein [Mycobacterium sp. JS623]
MKRHSPSPHQIPVIVVAQDGLAGQVVEQLNAIPGQPLEASASDDTRVALHALRKGETSGVYAQHNRTVSINDAVPLDPGDARGLSAFYLVVGWAVGGYLLAAMLGVAKGSRPATLSHRCRTPATPMPRTQMCATGRISKVVRCDHPHVRAVPAHPA